MPTKPIKPMGRSVNATPWWHYVINALIALLFGALGALFLVEWAAGCGETYTDAQGQTHQHECVFLTLKGKP